MQRTYRKTHGQTMVETALAIPFLLLVIVSIFYFGRYFYIQSVVGFAAQQAANLAASTPNLQDPNVRDSVRGFSTGGQATNTASITYNIFAAASLLSSGTTGDLPAGAQVLILPYDGGTSSPPLPSGAVAVQIQYPFNLFNSNTPVQGPLRIAMSPRGTPLTLPNLSITRQASIFPQVSQTN